MEKISGIDVQEHEKSKRILNIRLNNEIIEKLIFPFNKFDITALELKPFPKVLVPVWLARKKIGWVFFAKR